MRRSAARTLALPMLTETTIDVPVPSATAWQYVADPPSDSAICRQYNKGPRPRGAKPPGRIGPGATSHCKPWPGTLWPSASFGRLAPRLLHVQHDNDGGRRSASISYRDGRVRALRSPHEDHRSLSGDESVPHLKRCAPRHTCVLDRAVAAEVPTWSASPRKTSPRFGSAAEVIHRTREELERQRLGPDPAGQIRDARSNWRSGAGTRASCRRPPESLESLRQVRSPGSASQPDGVTSRSSCRCRRLSRRVRPTLQGRPAAVNQRWTAARMSCSRQPRNVQSCRGYHRSQSAANRATPVVPPHS